jgi:DivIVA domain-containing protein
MPTSPLDVPLLPSAEQIRRREFATIRRGYDPDQVRDYLESVAIQVGSLEENLREARLQMESLSAQPSSAPMPAALGVDPYDRISKRFAGLIATADREASRIVDDAKTEADRIKVDAQATAEVARQEGSDALGSARQEADRVLSGLSTRRDALVEQLQQMRARLLGVAQDLAGVIETPTADAGEQDAPVDDGSTIEDATDATDAPDAPESGASDTEDLWVSTDVQRRPSENGLELEELFSELEDGVDDQGNGTEAAMEIPDLASMELDFDEGSDSAD